MSKRHALLFALSRLLPAVVKSFVRRHVDMVEYDLYVTDVRDPYARESPAFVAPESPCTLGIVRELFHDHKSYITACRELGVSYKLLDILCSDWVQVIRDSQCDAFLVWPTVATTVWKEVFDDRLRVMEEQLGKIVYPTAKEHWIYESKRRTRDWLMATNTPHPRTWVFYNRREAEEFIHNANYPLVFKTNLGACHSGVQIVRTVDHTRQILRACFGRGVVPSRRNFRDRQWGSVLLQQYLPNVKEWRMVRIGNSYFGYRKERVGDFHSGSHQWSWLDPGRPLLDFLRNVTDKGGFTSMDIDVFETQEGRLLVNEMQTVFGAATPADQLRVDGKAGRYCYDEHHDNWVFEEGDFSRNACCNLRVEYLVRTILKKDLPYQWPTK